MSIDLDLVMRDQLVERRERGVTALSTVGPDPQLTALLRDVDAALDGAFSGTGEIGSAPSFPMASLW